MRKILILLTFMILVAGCSIPPEQSPAPLETSIMTGSDTPSPPDVTPLETSTPIPTPREEPKHRFTYLMLGGDYRGHRLGTRYGDKTDVMILVSIFDYGPNLKVDMVQFPRNFYYYFGPEGVAFPDMWLFHVFGREGFTGLHYYFQRVFDVDLDGIFYINMDNFVTLIDDASPQGILVNSRLRDGEEILKYLRDNDNNWGCSYYDCESRQFEVLWALIQHFHRYLEEDVVHAALTITEKWGGLYETDLSTWEQLVQGATLAWKWMQTPYVVNLHKLTQSGVVEYGDTPLEVRGWISSGDIPMWLWSVLRP
jgi:hypothetical protein